MTPEEDKAARQEFFVATGKTPDQEAHDSRVMFAFMVAALVVAACAGLFYLLH